MVELIRGKPLIVALTLLAATLLVAIAAETGFGTRLSPTIPGLPMRPGVAAEAKLLPPLNPRPAEQAYPEMTARPLFIATRRPAPTPEPAQQATMRRGQFILQGVTIAGDTRIALLREKANGKIHRVEKGHDINGMKLAEVNPDSVTLAQGKEQEVLPLQVLKAPPGPGGAIPAMPSGAATGPFPTAPAQGQPGFGPGQPSVGIPMPAKPAAPNHVTSAVPQPAPTTTPMSPEELLARRSARRAQQNQ